jgi:hypothetical protein
VTSTTLRRKNGSPCRPVVCYMYTAPFTTPRPSSPLFWPLHERGKGKGIPVAVIRGGIIFVPIHPRRCSPSPSPLSFTAIFPFLPSVVIVLLLFLLLPRAHVIGQVLGKSHQPTNSGRGTHPSSVTYRSSIGEHNRGQQTKCPREEPTKSLRSKL